MRRSTSPGARTGPCGLYLLFGPVPTGPHRLGARNVRVGPLREFAAEHHDAHRESSVVREKVSVLTWDTHVVPSNANSGCREPSPATVWNRDLQGSLPD